MVKGVVLNDIHFGVPETKRIYDELSLFKNFLIDNPDIKFVVIAGDYFDRRLSLSEAASIYAITFFSELMNIAKKNGITVRIIQGTRGHDLNQLNILRSCQSDDTSVDFRIIETVSTETLFGCRILYIPEEYPENQEEYYKEYKAEDKEYEMIFGHGTWLFQAPPGVFEKAMLDSHSAPVFIEDEWLPRVPNGFISFGHIHSRHIYPITTKIKPTTKIFYSGAFSRWDFSDRSERGFTYFEYDTDNKTYSVQFIDNTLAPNYDVLSVKDIEGIDLNTIQATELQQILDEVASKTDYLKINLAGLPDDVSAMIRNYYQSFENNVKIEIREKKSSSILESSVTNPEFEKYHYITKRELPLNETIKRYCSEDLGVDLKIEDITNAIN